ncbi:MAG: catalase family protein [Ginsengibacter sp.]
MAILLPQSDKKEIGHEYVSEDEHSIIGEMIEEMKMQLIQLYQNTRTLRQVHTKMHGCVKAAFTVLPGLSAELKFGVFKEPLTYPAWIRFSNANTIVQHDRKKDIRGVAIKLMNVPGEKLLSNHQSEQTQDFLLMSNEIFFSKNIEQFRYVLRAATAKNKLKLISYFLNPLHWSLLKRLLASNIPCKNPFEIPYWSTQPYRYGNESTAVKYFLKPSADNKLIIADTNDYNYLSINMAKTLAANEIHFDFFIQFQTDADKMPVEDPTIAWASPFIKVAEIKIFKQVFDTPEQMEFADNLSFDIWHSLPEHRPLGSFNRARKQAYVALSKFRHERNHSPVFEPTAGPDFFETI